MFDDWARELSRSMRQADNHRTRLYAEFGKLIAEPCMKVSSIGDRVIVATGLLGKGHIWARTECTVIETGDTSVKVRFTGDYINRDDEMWIHPLLITDNIGPTPSESPGPVPGAAPDGPGEGE